MRNPFSGITVHPVLNYRGNRICTVEGTAGTTFVSKEHGYLILLFTKIAQVGSPLMDPAKNLRLNCKEKEQTKCKLCVKIIMPYTLITDKKEQTMKRAGLTQKGKARHNKMLIISHCTLYRDDKIDTGISTYQARLTN
jgi:hypothetical protein